MATKTPITDINSKAISALGKEALELLKPLQEKYGVSVDIDGSLSYGHDKGHIRFAFTAADENGNAQSAGQVEWNKNAPLDGFDVSDFGRKFTHRGHEYQIVGYAPRNRKMPILVERSDGTAYKMPPELVLRELKK